MHLTVVPGDQLTTLSLSDLLYISILYPYLFRYSGKTILYIPEHREI